MSKPPLTNQEIYDLLHEMQIKCRARGETTVGETTLRTANAALFQLQTALLANMDDPELKGIDADD